MGLVIKMDQTRVTKKYFINKPVGKRIWEGRTLRWTEAIENDLRELNM
jgi:hypothetical protein